MKTRTVGADSLAAQSDRTIYDPMEIGEALTNDILEYVWECIDIHYNVIDEPEFCIILVRAGDPLLYNLMRKKHCAWPFIPKPRPEQIVFHYDKKTDSIIRLWSLPSAKVMAIVSETMNVSPQWKQTKIWCDAFFSGFRHDPSTGGYTNYNENIFYETIRKMHGITLESASEYLDAHRAELIQAGSDNIESPFPDSLDFSKIPV